MGMDFVDQLKSQLDIVDVVGHYVRLKRNGTSPRVIGLCPFHSEKTPSFGVHTTSQFYKCFGCDARGDLINFVMEIEGLTFWEAVKLLAERYGIPLPRRRQDNDPSSRDREAVLEMHELASKIFEDNLHSEAGTDARLYLQSRGLTLATIREFRLGLSDARGQQMVQRLQRFRQELMEQSGLVGKRQDGSGFYDRFRNRLMFPIQNESGKVIGFGGRALAPGDEPKYLNSPETKIYKKSLTLYNIHRAKAQARKLDRMFLVEGYMDAIGLSQTGITNTVASCGTALTNEQVRLIKRQVAHTDAFAGQVIVNFDPDPGGARGTERSIHMLLGEGLRVKVLTIPGEADPDEYVAEFGAERYLQMALSAPSYFHWLIDRAKQKFDVSSAEGRGEALQSLWPALQRVHDKIERNALIEDLAGRLDVPVQLIRDRFRQSNANAETIRRVVEISSSIPPNERLLWCSMLQSEDARAAVLQYLEQSGIPENLSLKAAFEALLLMRRAGFAFSLPALLDRLDQRDQKIISELSFQQLNIPSDAATAQALHCLRALEAKCQEDHRIEMKKRIRSAEISGNLDEALRLTEALKQMDEDKRLSRTLTR